LKAALKQNLEPFPELLDVFNLKFFERETPDIKERGTKESFQ
jgi:hypothetical protein